MRSTVIANIPTFSVSKIITSRFCRQYTTKSMISQFWLKSNVSQESSRLLILMFFSGFDFSGLTPRRPLSGASSVARSGPSAAPWPLVAPRFLFCCWVGGGLNTYQASGPDAVAIKTGFRNSLLQSHPFQQSAIVLEVLWNGRSHNDSDSGAAIPFISVGGNCGGSAVLRHTCF